MRLLFLFSALILYFPVLAKKVPMDSLTFQNDSCYYQGKLYSGKGFRQKSLEFTYKKGLKHGKFQQWHSNGQLFVKSKYKKNQQHGKYKSWNKEGSTDR